MNILIRYYKKVIAQKGGCKPKYILKSLYSFHQKLIYQHVMREDKREEKGRK